jgi:hypothetical protein
MKKLVYYLMFIILMFPTIIFASSTYDDGINIANKYIYDFQDYSRYIKLTGDLPYGINSSNKPVVVSDFKTGGFLNEKEYNMSIRNSASWLAPGIGYWLIGNKILDVRVSASVNANVVSGVRVTEFVKHDAKVKGNGTKTTPWYFTDGYIVKVGSSDLSLGTVTGNCEHVQDGGSCKHTLTYDTKVGVNINNCKKTVESKGATITLNGNELIISNVHSDISCLIDFGSNKCVRVDFNNAGGTGGMTTPIYYKYGFELNTGKVLHEWLYKREERLTKIFERKDDASYFLSISLQASFQLPSFLCSLANLFASSEALGSLANGRIIHNSELRAC